MFSRTQKRRLQPAEVFETAVGLLLSLNYIPLERLCDNTSVLGQIFEKDGERVVLYYPGKDNDKATSVENRTRPLSSIYTTLKNKISPKELENALEIFFVCESNQRSKHYVLALKKNKVISLYDSLSRFRLYYLENFRKIFPEDHTLETHYAGAQKDNYSCGIFALTTLKLFLTKKDISLETLNLNVAYQTMANYYKNAQGSNPNFIAPPPKKAAPTLTGYPKYLLIGALIGLTLAGVCVAAAFAWPLVLPAIGWLGVGLISGGAVALSTGTAYLSKFIRNYVGTVKTQSTDDGLNGWGFCSSIDDSSITDVYRRMQAKTGVKITQRTQSSIETPVITLNNNTPPTPPTPTNNTSRFLSLS